MTNGAARTTGVMLRSARKGASRSTQAGVLLSALLLSACAVGPDYRAPTPPAAGAFVAAGPAVSAEAPRPDWWRLFADPQLDALVARALEANRDLAAAQANLERVRASLSETRAARLPGTTLSASAQRVRVQNPVTGAFEEADAFSAGFDVAYEVDLFGRVGRAVEAARAEAGGAEALLDGVRLTVAAETARAYADACAANAQLAVARRTLELQRDTLDLTSRQLQAGRGTGLDVAGAGAQFEATQASLPPLEAARDAALFRLSTLVGVVPAEAPAAARTCATIPRVNGPIPVGDGAGLIARRPDVRQAERALAAATARVGVATAALYPSITLGGNIATVANDAGDLGQDFQFSLGPLISWRFPNIVAARARVRQAGAAADQSLAQFEGAVLGALSETETALSAYARALDRRAALVRARDRSAEAVRLARMRNEAGRDSFLVVLDAERTLASLEAQLAQSEAAVTTAQVVLFKALGGTWTPA
jgi:NodT family efflux transporter outer membrane factor (OMF) lipoprotein